jgi:hypothetical protein
MSIAVGRVVRLGPRTQTTEFEEDLLVRLRKMVGGAAVIVAGVLAVPAVAHADTCLNASRSENAPGSFAFETRGNWVWLPFDGGFWGFAPPGGPESVNNSLPGANGNYDVNKSASLLSASANCPPGDNTARQTTEGIQTGC